MKTKELFRRAIKVSSGIVEQVEKRHFTNETPCSEWNLKALTNHMLSELSWAPDCLAGKTVSEVGDKYSGDLLGDNHWQNWQSAAKRALKAAERLDLNQIVHLSYGDFSAKYYLRELADDLLIHSWDLAQGLNCSLWLDTEVLQVINDNISPRQAELEASGMFGVSIQPPKGADLQERVLGLVGRQIPPIDIIIG